MASNNTTKDQVLLLFPDNNNYEITAADMRAYIESVFSDREVVVVKMSTLADLAFNNANIYEGSLVVIYQDTEDNIGIYLSTANQPTLPSQLIQLSSIAGGGSASLERGGLAYDETKQYFIGDIVSNTNNAYIALSDSTAPAGPFDTNDWLLISSGNISVINDLNSTSTTDALSANQGRILDTTKEPNLPVGTGNGGYILTLNADEVTREWQPTTSRAIEWFTTIMYGVNNLVSYNGFMYKALQTGTGNQPDTSPTFWEHVFIEEAPQDGKSYWRKDGVWNDLADYGDYV